jgi:heme-degrading monooxygenase HmoA
MSRARVLLYYHAPANGPDPVRDAYHEASQALRGTPGLIGNELLHDITEAGTYVVLSEWASVEAFQAWEQGPRHRNETSPLRPFQDRRGRARHFGVYEVAASYGPPGGPA